MDSLNQPREPVAIVTVDVCKPWAVYIFTTPNMPEYLWSNVSADIFANIHFILWLFTTGKRPIEWRPIDAVICGWWKFGGKPANDSGSVGCPMCFEGSLKIVYEDIFGLQPSFSSIFGVVEVRDFRSCCCIFLQAFQGYGSSVDGTDGKGTLRSALAHSRC